MATPAPEPIEPIPTAGDEKSGYRAFAEEHFQEGATWREMVSILSGNGGSYGLSGARGSGKTWHMLKAREVTRAKHGVGLWYPSPSEYDSYAFLATLSDTLANEIHRAYRRRAFAPWKSYRSRRWFLRETLPSLAVVAALFVALYVVGPLSDTPYLVARSFVGHDVVQLSPASLDLLRPGLLRPLPFTRRSSIDSPEFTVAARLGRLNAEFADEGAASLEEQADTLDRRREDEDAKLDAKELAAVRQDAVSLRRAADRLDLARIGAVAVLVAALLGAFLLVRQLVRRSLPEGHLVREARAMRRRIRYASTERSGSEFGAGGTRGPRMTRTRQRELVERPTTLSSLIHDFRALASEAAAVSGTVVVGIDELDKMSSADLVRALLRDIKGIFEIAGVYFFVSVSDEAARDLSLGALGQRNEFNSSFYAVLALPPMSSSESETLVLHRHRAFDAQSAQVIGVLAAGLPREIVRLTEVVVRDNSLASWGTVERALAIVTSVEVREFLEEVVTASTAETEPGEETKAAIYETANTAGLVATPDGFVSECKARITRDWSPDWAGDDGTEEIVQQWRRLLVRLYVAGRLVTAKSDPDLARLQEIVRVAAHSAQVARAMLARDYPNELSPAPASGRRPVWHRIASEKS